MRLTRVFFDVDLRCAFEGLGEIAKKSKTPNNEDTSILFLNRKMTAFKLIRGKQYLVYFKNNGRKIPLDSLRMLPEYFGGSKLEFEQAVRRSLEEKMNFEF